MALLPYLLNDLLNERERDPVSRLFDQDFGVSLLNDDLYRPSIGTFTTPLLTGYIRPLRHVIPDDSGVSTVTRDKDNFKVSIICKAFPGTISRNSFLLFFVFVCRLISMCSNSNLKKLTLKSSMITSW